MVKNTVYKKGEMELGRRVELKVVREEERGGEREGGERKVNIKYSEKQWWTKRKHSFRDIVKKKRMRDGERQRMGDKQSVEDKDT